MTPLQLTTLSPEEQRENALLIRKQTELIKAQTLKTQEETKKLKLDNWWLYLQFGGIITLILLITMLCLGTVGVYIMKAL